MIGCVVAAVFAALLSIALFDFFFVPPRFTFAVSDLHYLFTCAVLLACALTRGAGGSRVAHARAMVAEEARRA